MYTQQEETRVKLRSEGVPKAIWTPVGDLRQNMQTEWEGLEIHVHCVTWSVRCRGRHGGIRRSSRDWGDGSVWVSRSN